MSPAARRSTTVTILALALLYLVWIGWLAPAPGSARWVLVAVVTLPLLLAAAALALAARGALVGSGLLLLVYFSHGILVGYAGGPSWPLGTAAVGLVLVYYASLLLDVYRRRRTRSDAR